MEWRGHHQQEGNLVSARGRNCPNRASRKTSFSTPCICFGPSWHTTTTIYLLGESMLVCVCVHGETIFFPLGRVFTILPPFNNKWPSDRRQTIIISLRFSVSPFFVYTSHPASMCTVYIYTVPWQKIDRYLLFSDGICFVHLFFLLTICDILWNVRRPFLQLSTSSEHK